MNRLHRVFQKTNNGCRAKTVDEIHFEYAELVAERYEREFGDRLTVEQILDSKKNYKIITECDQTGKVVAGVKLSRFSDSFTDMCMGETLVGQVFNPSIRLDELVEISKVVNVGGPLVISKLISKTYRWLRVHASCGFVSSGPRRNMLLWKKLVDGTWHRHWQATVVSIESPKLAIPQEIDLAMLHVKNCH